ncbi:lysozyme family protein [Domibacillus sp. PGB-M46]|uniref:lysozyme family protein n=1 Tax=Domibacillus sp. PGB-M46 TaxID=2910255 RepID=UPI001F5A69FC|nr:lysozyme family protein [Domibacillus sp. PGB-M46]MCI2255528.1 lysozyme family protein [Domibacillus sp. PGB-M46]
MYIKLAVFAVQHWKKLLILLIAIFMVMFLFFFGAQEQQQEGGYTGNGTVGKAQISAFVKQYEPLIAKYAAQYGVSDYTQLLLTKMLQESGGGISDVMQSSESVGLPRNTITDPEQPIAVGVKYFASVLKKARGDVDLALQSYNFGIGFIDYAKVR